MIVLFAPPGNLWLRLTATFLAIFTAVGLLHAEPALTITRTSKTKLDIKAEVVSYYQTLIAENTEVKEAYEKVVAAAEDDGYKAPIPGGDVTALEWAVADFQRIRTAKPPLFETDGTFTYLTFEPILLRFDTGYTIAKNVIARFTVTYHTRAKTNPSDPDADPTLVDNTFTIAFLGFVSLEIKE